MSIIVWWYSIVKQADAKAEWNFSLKKLGLIIEGRNIILITYSIREKMLNLLIQLIIKGMKWLNMK